jgi:hypothetical protein
MSMLIIVGAMVMIVILCPMVMFMILPMLIIIIVVAMMLIIILPMPMLILLVGDCNRPSRARTSSSIRFLHHRPRAFIPRHRCWRSRCCCCR